MRYLQAGGRRLVALEPDPDAIRSICQRAGFACEIEESPRQIVLKVNPSDDGQPFLLFDASEPANLGWFSRCQFYVDGFTGAVLQTPLTVANVRERGQLKTNQLRVALSTELPAAFRLPGRQTVSEDVLYSLLYSFLTALRETGVGICGRGSVQPLAGVPRRLDNRPRNR
jgi:hypothetical protein